MNYRYYPMLYNKKIDDFECMQSGGCVLETTADFLIRTKLVKLYGKYGWSKLGNFYYRSDGNVAAKIIATELAWK